MVLSFLLREAAHLRSELLDLVAEVRVPSLVVSFLLREAAHLRSELLDLVAEVRDEISGVLFTLHQRLVVTQGRAAPLNVPDPLPHEPILALGIRVPIEVRVTALEVSVLLREAAPLRYELLDLVAEGRVEALVVTGHWTACSDENFREISLCRGSSAVGSGTASVDGRHSGGLECFPGLPT